jgi:hypothetical protein
MQTWELPIRPSVPIYILLAICLGCAGKNASTAPQFAGGPGVAATAGTGRAMPANAVRVQRAVIMDNNGFDQPMPASFGLMPVGWRSQGGVQWDRQFACTNGYNFNWAASSPDGSQSIAITPMTKWETNNYGAASTLIGCPAGAASSVRQFLENALRQSPYGARPLDFRPRPDLEQGFAHLRTHTPTPMGETRTWVESGEILFAFQDRGRDMRGVMTTTVVFSVMRTNDPTSGRSLDVLAGTSLPSYVATAPNGQLNLSMTEAIRQSFIPNPGWTARITRHNSAIAEVAAGEAVKQGQIIAATNNYISELRSQVQANRERSSAYIAKERGELNRGVETYKDTYAPGGTVELSAYYNNAWRLTDGSYVLTDNLSFDPWRDLGLQGQKLEPTQ